MLRSVAHLTRSQCRQLAAPHRTAPRPRAVLRAASSIAVDDPHAELMADMTEFLKQDLEHLFDDTGIDSSRYESRMEFGDPLTRHTTLQGYLLNIQFLRRVFSPVFRLHDIKRTGPLQLTTRWTMDMKFSLAPPLVPWDPSLTFTGVSILDVDPVSRKLCRHVDLWDSCSDNSFLSREAISDLVGQLVDGVGRTRRDNTSASECVTLVRRKEYSIQRCASGDVAVAWLSGAATKEATEQCAAQLATVLRRDGIRYATSAGDRPAFSVRQEEGSASWAQKHEIRITLIDQFQLPWTI